MVSAKASREHTSSRHSRLSADPTVPSLSLPEEMTDDPGGVGQGRQVELAKQGLTGLTGVLGQIPTKVQGALTEACGALPGGDELKGVCTTGLADVIKKATEVLGKVCTAGTTALIGEATKACTTASTKADELLKSADGTPFSSPDCRF